jgi:signal transduction histidine kinase
VKKMADRMGAVVRAESSPGAGATFMVDLPKPKLAV